MYESALIIAIVLVAAIGLFRSFRRSLSDDKRTCSCGHGCSCAHERCTGHDSLSNSGCCDNPADKHRYELTPDGNTR